MLDKRPLLLVGALCAITMSLGACAGKDDGEGRNHGAPQVGYVTVAVQAVPVSTELGGRTVAFETSEVRPQVNGVIRRRLFTEGGFVRAGQPLYQIDASLYSAAVDQAAANLASARRECRGGRRRWRRPLQAAGRDARRSPSRIIPTPRRRRASAARRRRPERAPRSKPRGSTCATPP